MKMPVPGGLMISSVFTAGVTVAQMIHLSHGVPSLPKLIAALTVFSLIYERGRSFKRFEKHAAETAPDPVQHKRLVDRTEGEAAFAVFAYQMMLWVGIEFAQR